MNWTKDNAGISERDLEKVYKYDEKPAVIATLRPYHSGKITVLETGQEWEARLAQECPDNINTAGPGLVLVLAQCPGQRHHSPTGQVSCDEWLELNHAKPKQWEGPEGMSLNLSKCNKDTLIRNTEPRGTGGRRGVRSVPFSRATFRDIIRRLRIHASISAAISRTDVSVFSAANIQMMDLSGRSHCALVYNCRSSNAWPDDMALSLTYFPHLNLTFAIWFGCTSAVEHEVIRRLSTITLDTTHPLLLPGMFVEIERSRHIGVVDTTIAEMETRIAELSFRTSDIDDTFDADADRRHSDRRSAWLDTTYLRNHLISWKTQLDKMELHLLTLKATIFRKNRPETAADQFLPPGHFNDQSQLMRVGGTQLTAYDFSPSSHPANASRSSLRSGCVQNPRANCERCDYDDDDSELYGGQSKSLMRVLGDRMASRLQAIQEEYDGKIRDCTMRVDGMSMATQWAQGETSVAIALATKRDSKHMRSIALVTMIFLPGTLIAGIFSMSLFQWDSENGPAVSSYFWVYVVITVAFTLLTVGSWWYLVVHRRPHHAKMASADASHV